MSWVESTAVITSFALLGYANTDKPDGRSHHFFESRVRQLIQGNERKTRATIPGLLSHLCDLCRSCRRAASAAGRVDALWPVSDRATPADRRSPIVGATTVLRQVATKETCGRTQGGVGDPRPARVGERAIY